MAGPSAMKPARVQPVPPPMNSPEGKAAAAAAAEREAKAKKELPKWRRGFRKTVPWLFLILLSCVVMQIALAGAGLLGDPDYWTMGTSPFLDAHRWFVLAIEVSALFIVLSGFLGADKEAGVVGIVVIILSEAQYALIDLNGVARSFHVLNALVIFTLALLMTLSRIPWRPSFLDAAPEPKA